MQDGEFPGGVHLELVGCVFPLFPMYCSLTADKDTEDRESLLILENLTCVEKDGCDD